MNLLRLGTRKSPLAQAQAHWTAARLRSAFPEVKVEIVLITTSGDLLQPSPYPLPKGRGLDKIGLPPLGGRWPAGPDEGPNLKALFTKEIEDALLDHRIDLAVHSLKDMSAVLPKGLLIGAVPEREDARDAWISKSKSPFKAMAKNAVIGTGAVRRQAQLQRLFPDATFTALRGNVDTRLQKLADGSMDGLILALAGLRRLGRQSAVTEALEIDVLLPAVGQGCLGIESREKDPDLMPFLKALDHPASHVAANAERAFLKTLGGSCQTPIAGHAILESGELILRGLVISPDGQNVVSAKENGRPFDAEGIGERLAQKLLENGANKLLA